MDRHVLIRYGINWHLLALALAVLVCVADALFR